MRWHAKKTLHALMELHGIIARNGHPRQESAATLFPLRYDFPLLQQRPTGDRLGEQDRVCGVLFCAMKTFAPELM